MDGAEGRNFYVYAHCLPDGTPFYIGRGKDHRAKTTNGRTKWWKRVVEKYYGGSFPKVKYLSFDLTLEESNDIERFWIAVFGRKNERQDGLLVNISEGGIGNKGHKKSDEWKAMMSVRMRGEKNPHYGKKVTQESLIKRNETIKRREEKFGKISFLSEERKQKIADYRYEKFIRKQIAALEPRKSPPNKGVKMSPELYKKYVETRPRGENHPYFGKKRPVEVNKKISEAHIQSVLILADPEGNIHQVWNRTEFVEKYGIDVNGFTQGKKVYNKWCLVEKIERQDDLFVTKDGVKSSESLQQYIQDIPPGTHYFKEARRQHGLAISAAKKAGKNKFLVRNISDNTVEEVSKNKDFIEKHNLPQTFFQILVKNKTYKGWELLSVEKVPTPKPSKASTPIKGRPKPEGFSAMLSARQIKTMAYLISPEGQIYEVHNRTEFARKHNLRPNTLGELIDGKHKTHRGWKLLNRVSIEEYNLLKSQIGLL